MPLNRRNNRLVIPHKEDPSNPKNLELLERWGNSQVVNQIVAGTGITLTQQSQGIGKGTTGTGLVTVNASGAQVGAGPGLSLYNYPPTGVTAENYPRPLVGINGVFQGVGSGGTAAFVFLGLVWLPKGYVLNQIGTYWGSNSTANTWNHRWGALTDTTGSTLAATADSTAAPTINSLNFLSLTSAFTVSASSLFYICYFVQNTGANNPLLLSMNLGVAPNLINGALTMFYGVNGVTEANQTPPANGTNIFTYISGLAAQNLPWLYTPLK